MLLTRLLTMGLGSMSEWLIMVLPYPIYFLLMIDILIFSKSLASQAKILATVFSQCSKESGLIINLAKSRAFYSSGVPRQNVEKITTITSIRSTLSLKKYVGFPMLNGIVKHSDYAFILDKLNHRLSWKNNLLNKAGRITLAKSVLNSIPTYYMKIS